MLFGEGYLLIGNTERSIVMQTRKRNPIRNTIAPEPGEAQRQKYLALRSRFGRNWTNRKPPCGVYNCFGMAFASRRTSIEEQVEQILEEDDYRLLSEHEHPRAGDLAVYRDAKHGLLHVAVIMEIRPLVNDIGRRAQVEERGAVLALSKWNDSCGEDLHHVEHHCWTPQDDYDVTIEYWTDRPT